MGHYSAAHIRQGIGHFLVGRAAAGVLSLIVNIVLVRVLPERDFAAYVTLTALQLFIITLAANGLERVVARYVPAGVIKGAYARVSVFMVKLLTLKALAVALILIISTLLAERLETLFSLQNIGSLLPAFWIYTIGFALFETLMGAAQALMLQRAIKLHLGLQWGLRLAALGGLIGFDVPMTLGVVLWVFAITAALSSIGLAVSVFAGLWASRGDLSRSPAESWPKDVRPIIQLGVHNYLQGLVWLPSSGASLRLLAATFLTAAATGAFGFFQSLAGTLQRYMPVTLMMGLIEPAMAGRYEQRRDIADMNSVMSTAMKINLIMLTPLIVWLFVAGRDVVSLLTGGKFADLAVYLPILVAGLIPGGHWQVFTIVANTVEKSHVLLRATMATNGVLLMAVIAVINWPSYGLAALVLGGFIVETSRNAIGVAMIRGCGVDYRPDHFGMIKIAIAGLAAGLIGQAVADVTRAYGPWFTTTISLSTIVIVFLAIMAWIKAFTPEERGILSKVTGRFPIPL